MSDGRKSEEKSFNPYAKRTSFSSWRSNQYPEIKLRGYYSDVTSQHNLDKTSVSQIYDKFFFRVVKNWLWSLFEVEI